MIRNLKALLLAMAAVLAMGAVTAVGAQAATFTSPLAETTVTSTPDGTGTSSHHVFDAAGASITCSTAHFHGVAKGTSTPTVPVTATYGGCTFLGASVAVNMNGCQYEFNANGTVTIINHPGKNCTTSPISFAAPGCTVTVGAQGPLGTVTYTNVKPGTSGEITVSPKVEKIKYTSSGFLCPKQGTFEDGNYTTGNTYITCAPLNDEVKTVDCLRDA